MTVTPYMLNTEKRFDSLKFADISNLMRTKVNFEFCELLLF
jgi:hypothetical protein